METGRTGDSGGSERTGMRKLYMIEGAMYYFRDIRAKVPESVKTCTLKQRLWWYRYDTWEQLCSAPNKRRRPRRVVVKTQPEKAYRPAFTGEW